MKKILLSLVIIAGISLTATAQNTNKPTTCCEKQDCNQKMKKKSTLRSELNLSEQQVNDLKKARENFRDKAKVVRENKSLNKDERRKQIQALRSEKKEATDKIYIAEQKELLKNKQKIQQRRPNRAFTHKPRMDRKRDMNIFSKELNLTDAQKEQIKVLNKDFKDKCQKLRKEHKENIAKTLTPEQQKQLEKQHKRAPMKQKRGERKAPIADKETQA